MLLSQNPSTLINTLTLNSTQRQMLEQRPLADYFMDLDLPYLPGSRIVHCDFSASPESNCDERSG